MIGPDTLPFAAIDVDLNPRHEKEAGDTQLEIALRRLRSESCSSDPSAAVAAFNSAF
jgi:hypothetical protein